MSLQEIQVMFNKPLHFFKYVFFFNCFIYLDRALNSFKPLEHKNLLLRFSVFWKSANQSVSVLKRLVDDGSHIESYLSYILVLYKNVCEIYKPFHKQFW